MDWLRIAPPLVVAASFALAFVIAFVGRRVRLLAPLLALLAPLSVLVVGLASLAQQPLGEGVARGAERPAMARQDRLER